MARLLSPESEELAVKIEAHLLKVQKREVAKDTGHGFLSVRRIAEAVGMDTKACRQLLDILAMAGRVKRLDFSNGLFWRTTNPLPWEVGGELHKRDAEERAMWQQPLVLVVQAVFHDERGKPVSRDVKAYPEGLRHRAVAQVNMENRASEARRATDRADGRHLGRGYTSPPTFRLVRLESTESAAVPA